MANPCYIASTMAARYQFHSASFQPQNTLEQKDDLISMYALAPDIADMIASVYQNQNSINTTTQSHPDRDVSRIVYFIN